MCTRLHCEEGFGLSRIETVRQQGCFIDSVAGFATAGGSQLHDRCNLVSLGHAARYHCVWRFRMMPSSSFGGGPSRSAERRDVAKVFCCLLILVVTLATFFLPRGTGLALLGVEAGRHL